MTPSVDILLATFNGEKFLERQIMSVQNQTFENWTLLISDDNSTDSTVEIIREFQRHDERIRLVSLGRKGSAKANFHSLLAYSNADFSLFCDQDDFWFRDKIERMIKFASALPKNGPLLVASDAYLVDEDEEIIGSSFLSESRLSASRTSFSRVLTQNPVLGCSAMMNRELRDLIQTHPSDQSRIVMHDWWAAIVASGFGSLGVMPDRTLLYRQHGSNQVGSFSYSLRGLFNAAQSGRSRTQDILDQAREFQRCFSNEIAEPRLSELQSLLNTFKSPRLTRPARLVKNRSLKKGVMRALGQIFFAVTHTERK